MPDPGCCQAVVQLLLTRLFGGQFPVPPFILPPFLQQQQHPAPFAQPAMHPPTPLPQPAGTPSQWGAAQAPPATPAATAAVPTNSRTLWVGGLHESVDDEALLAAFRRHGELTVGYLAKKDLSYSLPLSLSLSEIYGPGQGDHNACIQLPERLEVGPAQCFCSSELPTAVPAQLCEWPCLRWLWLEG